MNAANSFAAKVVNSAPDWYKPLSIKTSECDLD